MLGWTKYGDDTRGHGAPRQFGEDLNEPIGKDPFYDSEEIDDPVEGEDDLEDEDEDDEDDDILFD